MNDKLQQLSASKSLNKRVNEKASGLQQGVDNTFKNGKAVVDTAVGVTEAVQAQTYQILTQATQRAGQVAALITNNGILRRVTGFLRLNWLLGAVDEVDVVKAEAAVRKLQQEHPQDSPSQIAHRIIVEKSIYAGGVGLLTSLVPGEAIALLAVDWATTTRIQAEMVYQIAAAYGMELKNSDRQGEVMAIFGLALGGGRAVKAGLGLLRNLPVAGAAIGASTNAAMLYSLGYAACRFYEAKLNEAQATVKLEEVKAASENYLETAIAQQAVMDQILVHMILASHPGKSEKEIMPKLQGILSPASMTAIEANLKNPQPLQALLYQLNRDFAFPLLAQCYRIAQLDSAIQPAQKRVMEAIATKFDIDLDAIKSAIKTK